MRKHVEMAKILERRIEHGDYAIMKIPAERTLAEEMNVSHMTARKAIQLLIENHILVRQENGRLAVKRQRPRSDGISGMQFGFAIPAFPSLEYQRWQLALEQTAKGFGVRVRPVPFVHWEDPVLLEALEGFDGLFLISDPEPIGAAMMDRLLNASLPLVMVGSDWSNRGVPSVVSSSPHWVGRLLDHLYELGHRSIDCFNTQPMDQMNTLCLRGWEHWRAEHHVQGQMINDPVAPYTPAGDYAYELASRLLRTGQWRPTAVLCSTMTNAIAVMRACYEHKLIIGKDVSICTLNGSGMAHLSIPTVTSFQEVERSPLLSVCVEWMIRSGQKKDWIGNLLVEPSGVELFIGESTGPCPQVAAVDRA